MAAKKSAVDRVIEKLEAEKIEIDKTIARLRDASAATTKARKARKPSIKDTVAPQKESA